MGLEKYSRVPGPHGLPSPANARNKHQTQLSMAKHMTDKQKQQKSNKTVYTRHI